MATELMDGERMKRFWDGRAREDAFYFVDSRQAYGRPDLEHFWAEGATDLDYMLELLDAAIQPTDIVVEIGCGLGRMTRVLAARAARVIALDVSREMLSRARALNPELDNVEWLAGDGTTLRGIADSSADACVSAVVFQHIPDPEITLGYVRDIGRVLRSGGWAAVQVSNDPSVHVPRTPRRDRLRALVGRAPRGRDNPAWLGSAVDLDELARAAREGGLAVEKVWGAGTQYCHLRLRRRPEGL